MQLVPGQYAKVRSVRPAPPFGRKAIRTQVGEGQTVSGSVHRAGTQHRHAIPPYQCSAANNARNSGRVAAHFPRWTTATRGCRGSGMGTWRPIWATCHAMLRPEYECIGQSVERATAPASGQRCEWRIRHAPAHSNSVGYRLVICTAVAALIAEFRVTHNSRFTSSSETNAPESAAPVFTVNAVPPTVTTGNLPEV